MQNKKTTEQKNHLFPGSKQMIVILEQLVGGPAAAKTDCFSLIIKCQMPPQMPQATLRSALSVKSGVTCACFLLKLPIFLF